MLSLQSLIVAFGCIAAGMLVVPSVAAWLLTPRERTTPAPDATPAATKADPAGELTYLQQLNLSLTRAGVSGEERKRILEPILIRVFFGEPATP